MAIESNSHEALYFSVPQFETQPNPARECSCGSFFECTTSLPRAS
jgi:hypothetical protein